MKHYLVSMMTVVTGGELTSQRIEFLTAAGIKVSETERGVELTSIVSLPHPHSGMALAAHFTGLVAAHLQYHDEGEELLEFGLPMLSVKDISAKFHALFDQERAGLWDMSNAQPL